MKEKQQGLIAILSANVIFGLNIPVTKALMDQWMTPWGYTMTRLLFGALLFWGIGCFFKMERVKKRDLFILLIGGLLGFLGTQIAFAQSLKYTTPVVFSLLMALAPVSVLLLAAIFLQESVPRRKVLGILLSVVGAALIIVFGSKGGKQASNHFLGILYAIACILFYSGYLILTRKISIRYHPLTIAKWMFLSSALAILPFSFSELPKQEIYSADTTITALSLLSFSLLFSSTLAFFLMPVALKRLEAGTVSIFMNLQPIVASGVAISVGQDVFTVDKVVATLLVLSGVYMVTRK